MTISNRASVPKRRRPLDPGTVVLYLGAEQPAAAFVFWEGVDLVLHSLTELRVRSLFLATSEFASYSRLILRDAR